MRILDKARLRLRSLCRRPNVDSEIDAELRFHLDQLIEENISSGMPREEARRAAQRTIGGIAQYKEECRDMRRVNFVEDFLQDVSYTIRSLAKSPGFPAVVVATLALGIGANTAIFTIVHGVLLRPLDYPKPDQLMYLTAEAPATGATRSAISAPEYIEFREMNRSFAAVGAYSTGGAPYTTGEVNLTGGDRPLRVRSISVDAHLLKALGIQPEQGRFFTEEETAHWTGTLPPAIAILSHELWRTVFGGRSLVGQRVEIDGRPHEIVGIMPPRADVMDNQTQVWLPLWLHPSMARQREAHVPLRDCATERRRHRAGGTEEAERIPRKLGRSCRRARPCAHEPSSALNRSHPRIAAVTGRDGWGCQPPDLGPAGRRGIRAVHRLRESCKPGDGSRRFTQT
ncbi:MAG: ABC transporter permease [Acidobacteriaceae bacterium]|nr:ABC transporter permease [Acidobacteriaceae bacterium]